MFSTTPQCRPHFLSQSPDSAVTGSDESSGRTDLGDVLGITHVNYVAGNHSLAVVDSTLAMTSTSRAEPRKSGQYDRS